MCEDVCSVRAEAVVALPRVSCALGARHLILAALLCIGSFLEGVESFTSWRMGSSYGENSELAVSRCQ